MQQEPFFTELTGCARDLMLKQSCAGNEKVAIHHKPCLFLTESEL